MATLASAATLLAVSVAVLLTKAFVALAPKTIPRVTDLAVDYRACVFSVLVTGVVTLILVLVPGRRFSLMALKDGGLTTTPGGRTLFVRRVVIAIQIAMVLALLAAAGLVSLTLLGGWFHQPLASIPERVNVVRVTPTERSFVDRPRYQQAMDDVRRAAVAVPGRREVALSYDPPLAERESRMQVQFLERAPAFVSVKFVSDGFFDTMRTPLLAGRDFGRSDYGTGNVAIVNQLFAETYFGSVSGAVGRI